MWTHYEWTRP